MKLEKILKLTITLFGLVFFSNAYGNINDNNPFQEKEEYENHDYIFKQNSHENLAPFNPFFSELTDTSNDYNKAGGPPGPPDDDEPGASIDNHLMLIFLLGIVIVSLFAKKYSQLRNN